MSFWIVLGVLAAIGVWLIAVYNGLVGARNQGQTAWSQIDVQLKRRHDLVPNLVEVARKYLAHEAQTLEAVIAARNQARTAEQAASGAPLAAGVMGTLSGAEQLLGGAIGRLMAVAEDYPELKADATMRELSEELASTENRIGFARQAYNDHTLAYNDAVQEFPALIVARLFGFTPQAMLESTTSDAERQPVRVQF